MTITMLMKNTLKAAKFKTGYNPIQRTALQLLHGALLFCCTPPPGHPILHQITRQTVSAKTAVSSPYANQHPIPVFVCFPQYLLMFTCHQTHDCTRCGRPLVPDCPAHPNRPARLVCRRQLQMYCNLLYNKL